MYRYPHGILDEDLVNLVNKPDPLVCECGAHDGRDTKRFLHIWPDCRIVAFEPDPRPLFRQDPPGFYRRIGNDDRVTCIAAALSNKNGTATLHRSSGTPPNKSTSDWDHSSSLSEPTGHLEWSPWCTFPQEKQITVPVCMLDTVGECADVTIDLMWVDVQGGQRKLIDGALNTLERTRLVYMECHKIPMYNGEPTQGELCDTMIDLGFETVALYEGYNFLFAKRG